MTILVVDDCTDSARVLALLLKTEGHSVRAVFSGPAALEAIKATVPEVVFLDLGMPKMDGFEVAKIIRSLHAPDRVALIACTGYCSDSVQERCRESGFDHFLAKPADFRRVRELLASIASEHANS